MRFPIKNQSLIESEFNSAIELCNQENDIVDLETTYIKKELDQYSRDIINNIEHDISLTGLFQIVAIRHETIVETVISTYHHHNRIAIMIKPYNPNSK